MVLELLSKNLLGLIKHHQFTGILRRLVHQIAKQMLLGLNSMHHCCRTIPADLKPKNTLVVLDNIKVCIATKLCTSALPSTHLVHVPPSTGCNGNQMSCANPLYIMGSQPLPSFLTCPPTWASSATASSLTSTLKPAKILDKATCGIS
jgi:serine/threonine protein kinase